MNRITVGSSLLLLVLGGTLTALARAGAGDQAELRRAVEAHRLAERDQVRREDAYAGRRLSAQERAELREQLRREWALFAEPTEAESAQSHAAERVPPGSVLPRNLRP